MQYYKYEVRKVPGQCCWVDTNGNVYHEAGGRLIDAKIFVNHQGYVIADVEAEDTKLGCRNKKIPYVHRLVALAFYDNPKNQPVVHHIDGDTQNNFAGNLMQCTYQYNNTVDGTSFRGGKTRSENRKTLGLKGSKRPVLWIDNDLHVHVMDSVKSFALAAGTTQQNGSDVLKKIQSKYGIHMYIDQIKDINDIFAGNEIFKVPSKLYKIYDILNPVNKII